MPEISAARRWPGRLRRAPRRPAAVLLPGLLLATCLLPAGCSRSREAPTMPTASEGLLVLLPSGEGGVDLASVRLSDGQVRMLTDSPEMPKEEPLWVSSIQRALFVGTLPGSEPPRSRLMLVDPLTGKVQGVTDRTADNEQEPSVSADGKEVVYRFQGPTMGGNADGLKIVRAMTANERMLRIPPVRTWFQHPHFAPDGLSVVVELRRRAGGSDLRVLYETVGESATRILTEDRSFSDRSPRFDRNGREVWFDRSRAARAGPGGPLGGGDVCAVEVDTQVVRCLDAGPDAREYAVRPSPTRDEVVFLRERPDGTELRIADAADEQGRTLLAAPGPDPRDPSWSPDGERIAFAWGPPGSSRVTVVDRSGKVVLETSGSSPAWAPPLAPSS